MSTAMTSVDYKSLLKDAFKLRGKAGANAYRRAKILVEVFEETDFVDQECNGNSLDAERKLDAYVEDLCLSFLELRDMLKFRPHMSQWCDSKGGRGAGGRLKKMYSDMIRAREQERQNQKPKSSRSIVSPKQDTKLLERENMRARSRNAFLQRELEQARSTPASSGRSGAISANTSAQEVERPSLPIRSPAPDSLALAWGDASDDERRYLIDLPEFQRWCRERGFQVVRIPLAQAGH